MSFQGQLKCTVYICLGGLNKKKQKMTSSDTAKLFLPLGKIL